MSLIQHDWECTVCQYVCQNVLSKRPAPKTRTLFCLSCDTETMHERLFPMPARYLGEKLRNDTGIRIKGGKYDTEGFEELPDIPDLPGAEEHAAKVSKALEQAESRDQGAKILTEQAKDAPDGFDYRAHMEKPEIAEIVKEREVIDKRNVAKAKRAKLIDQGKATIRQMPLPGDAKEHHR